MDLTCASNGEIQTHAGYYEMSVGRKRNPGHPLKRLMDSNNETRMDNEA